MTNRIKYPRTFHLPFSPGVTSDDKKLKDVRHLQGKQVVITEKFDGENSTLLKDGFHARSIDSGHHPSRAWLGRFHGQIAHEIPEGWRICGENLFAKHSLGYENLPSFFLGFSVWDETNYALSWDDTLEMFELLGVTPVRELFRGAFDETEVQALARSIDTEKQEGFVVRLADRFSYEDFRLSVAKWVRPAHVTTSDHWMHQAIVPNKLQD